MAEKRHLEEEDISLAGIIQKLGAYKNELLSKWRWLLFGIIPFVIAGWVYAFVTKPIYIARTTFMLETSKEQGLPASLQVLSQFGLGTLPGLNVYKIESLLKTRRVIGAALLDSANINGKKDLLLNHYLAIFGSDANIRMNANDTNINDESLQDFKFNKTKLSELSFLEDSVLHIIYENIVEDNLIIEVSDETEIISIQVETKNELFTKYLAQYLVQALSNFYITNITQKESEIVETVESRVDSIAMALAGAEIRYARWQDASHALIKASGHLKELQLKREVTILNIMYAGAVKNLEIARFNLQHETPIIQVIDPPVLPLEKNEIPAILGFILGGVLGGILIIGFFTVKKIIQDALEEEFRK